MIRKATAEDISFVEEIYNEITSNEEIIKFTQWMKGLYPTVLTAQKSFEEGTLFVSEDDGVITGAVILNHEQPEEYKKLKWSIEAEGEKVLVIHTLCIKPSFSKMGLGQKFIIFAENYAKELGCTAIRFDTNDKNVPGANLYKKMGYTHVGNADFNFQGLKYQNLKCFDKVL